MSQIQGLKIASQSGQLSENRRKRRKRTDDDGRNHICECGKSYLSYPALYTHIKTKHKNSQISQKILKAQAQQVFDQAPSPPSPQPLFSQNLPQANPLQILRQFLFKYFPNINVRAIQSFKSQLTIQQRNQIKSMKSYWENHKKQDQKEDEVYNTMLFYVLGKFVQELEQDVQNYCCRKYINLFAIKLRKALDKIKGQNYTNTNNAAELPQLLQQILIDFFLKDQNQFISNPTVIVKTIYYFSRWLYVSKFTNLSLKYNF